MAMNRILLTGTTLFALIGAIPASAAHKHAARYQPAPVQGQWSGSGARIEGVDPNSPAERAGLRSGDLIVGINGSPINNHSDVDSFVARGGGRPITIDVKRGAAIVRLRATPRQGMLGYSYTYYPFCPGGEYCGSSEPPPPYIPPPIPTPPPDIPPPFPIQN
jgi:membrane-associated protease RseP (regulator of RpoE activity)